MWNLNSAHIDYGRVAKPYFRSNFTSGQAKPAEQFSSVEEEISPQSRGLIFNTGLLKTACAAGSCWNFTSCMRNSGKNSGKHKTTAISHRKNCNAAIPLHCCNKIWSLEQKDDKAAQPILNGISFCCLTQASHAFDDKKGFWTMPLIICSNFWSPLKYSGSWIRWLF